MRLAGKAALITGAAGGQGRAAAARFAREGARVAVTDRDLAAAETVAQSIRDAGGEAVALALDVTAEDSIRAGVDTAVAAFGGLHILYNNAGINTGGSEPAERDTHVADLAVDVWHKMLAINLTGTFLCCKYGVPALIKSGGGSVVNIASSAGLVGGKVSGAAYSASKGGVISLTRAMAGAYADQNVRVNAICPSTLDVLMEHGIPRNEERMELLTGRFPIKRLGTADDVVNLALFLASDESAWMTGAIIPVDGGMTAVRT